MTSVTETHARGSDTLDEVRRIIAEELHVDLSEIRPETHLVDHLNATSITLVILIMKLEACFGIEVPSEDLRRLVIVKDAVAYVEARIAGGAR
jgi:acyl carrier protein